jgi:hypothetical protein
MKVNPKSLFVISIVILIVAGFLVWKRIGVAAEDSQLAISSDEGKTLQTVNCRKVSVPHPITLLKDDHQEGVADKSLSLPVGAVVKDSPEKELSPARSIVTEDAILAAGSIQLASTSVLPSADKASREKSLESIIAKDWQGQPNLLVNEIRAARGFQIPLMEVEDFLAGRDMLGWNEGQRNWIGDELMIMLRQEVPQEAYRIFQSVLADPSAPDAMRDYSVQHISHLVAAGQVGKEGVTVIRNALESGDPIYASTALVSLHRLSTTQPQFISPEQVIKVAKQLENSPDQRTQLTAKAIGVEWTNAKK